MSAFDTLNLMRMTQQQGPPEERAGKGGAFNKLDSFIGSPGGGFLMNILAQSGYSPMPHSPLGAIGKAAIMTSQQQAGRQDAAAKRKLMEAQGKYYNAKANEGPGDKIGKISPGLYTPSSVEQFSVSGNYDDLEVRPDAPPAAVAEHKWFMKQPDHIKEQHMTLKRGSRLTDIPGSGFVTQDPLNPTSTNTVVPESSVVGGMANRALIEGEAGRGRVYTPPGDDTGILQPGGFSAVPGSQAAVSEEETERQRTSGSLMKSIQAQTVVEDITRLNKQISDNQVPFGRMAETMSQLNPVAQTDGYRNAVALIESVKGNVGIDSLIRIKQSGAGLGQVPQKQLDLLSRLLGELNLNQSKEQFVDTWNRMGKVYKEIWSSADKDMIELGAIPPEVFDMNIAGPSTQELIDGL